MKQCHFTQEGGKWEKEGIIFHAIRDEIEKIKKI